MKRVAEKRPCPRLSAEEAGAPKLSGNTSEPLDNMAARNSHD
jgi:hypothetical protein